jgi:hypothetical protein
MMESGASIPVLGSLDSIVSNAMRQRFAWLRQRTFAILVLLGGFAMAGGEARATDPFRVDGVTVDVSAADGVTARQQAIDDAQRQGLQRVLRRLAAQVDDPRLPDAAGLRPADYVRSYEIANERVAPTRYIGTFNITYRQDAVERLLRDRGVMTVDQVPSPILVVPASRVDGDLVLWPADGGPWRNAWGQVLADGSLVDIVLPLGDLGDMATLAPEQAMAGDEAAAQALADRYAAVEVVVATVEEAPAPGQESRPVRVTLAPMLAQEFPQDPAVLDLPSAAPTEDPWEAAARASLERLNNQWKSKQEILDLGTAALPVTVPLADLASWVQVRRALGEAPQVREVRVNSFSRSAAEITMTYAGNVEGLVSALEQRGLVLSSENGEWLLRSLGGQLAPRGL